MLVQSSA